MNRLPLTFLSIILLFSNLLQAKTYTVAYAKDYFPYTFENEAGQPEGFLIDWWKLWAAKTNSTLKFVGGTPQEGLTRLKKGEVDILGVTLLNTKDIDHIHFNDPILRLQTLLFLKEDYKGVANINSNFIIGVMKGSIGYNYLKKQRPHIHVKAFTSFALLRNAVTEHTVDGYVYDYPNSLLTDGKVPATKGYYPHEKLYMDRLRSAVRNNNTELIQLILVGTEEINKSELLAIAEKWNFYKKDTTTRWLVASILALLIAIIVYLWLSLLKRKRKEQNRVKFESGTDWQVILDKGENDQIEFKSSLRWDYRQGKINKALEHVIVKTISAFMNTDGGMLFIGVDDDGNALGLEKDYSTFGKKNRDGFMLALTTLINQSLGKKNHQFISINIISVNEKDVCIVTMEKSVNPVFVGKGDKEEFFIRASASSQPLGMRETYEYIQSNWGKHV